MRARNPVARTQPLCRARNSLSALSSQISLESDLACDVLQTFGAETRSNQRHRQDEGHTSRRPLHRCEADSQESPAVRLTSQEEVPVGVEPADDVIFDPPPPQFAWNRPQRRGQLMNLLIGLGAIISAIMGLERLLIQ